ncbi:sigma-70 family RNA polymerase sigma factor [Crossiella sp. CA-258035]|uniref:sigma-70 family RNA polymerase sigma factor n=1 Tax=Crossiella sp. CA-258035 TaxID=2981138 RepID=UPI0024BC1AFD|nr:sigma-70 family RNA polymerase sigma factor [Crossiella sp. CA-258035]WHT16590.1 sigma-70 family RNA polymerase sigma factor [Crossiella sp. CA-258035]
MSTVPSAEPELLAAAQRADHDAFGQLVTPYRDQLFAYCYRMLGSTHDAEDAVQDALVKAWKGIGGFEGRASVKSWLYRIATNVCLDEIRRRPRRILTDDYAPPAAPDVELTGRVDEPIWLQPCPDDRLALDPAAGYELRESVELAFLVALQHLPATQRAVLVLREVLGFSAAEVAATLDTSVPSVNSALQRARATIRTQPRSQRAELTELGDDGQRELLAAFIEALQRSDVDAMVSLLAEDVRFTMPPMPFWFNGREDVVAFLTGVVLKESWRRIPVRANGQLAFGAYMDRGEGHRLVAVDVLTVRDGRIAAISAFLDGAALGVFGLPAGYPP